MPESPSTALPPGVTAIDAAAEAWVRRIQAGLPPEEEVEFSDWLEADPRHEPSFQKYRAAWQRFEPLAAEYRPPAHKSGRLATLSWWRWAGVGLAAAAAVALMVRLNRPVVAGPVVLPAPIVQQTLPDGSIVELNRGAEIAVDFSTTERRVALLHGEANFQVAKNPTKPFIVDAGGVKVRAVGTAFNVRFDPSSVQVVVTEGKVRVDKPATVATAHVPAEVATASFLEAGQKATVPLAATAYPAEVVTLAAPELERELLWQPKLLDFDNAPLAEIAAEFNRRNPVHLVIRDPAIASRRMTATFRSDNLETFVRMIETNIGVKAERLSDTEIALVSR